MNISIQNYNDHADEWSKELRAGRKLPHEYIEKPAMYSALTDIKAKDVLCAGCGTGEECAYLATKKPRSIIGFDLARKMIEIAKENYRDPLINFQVMDIEKMTFEDNSLDFIYSSLTLHYSKEWIQILSDFNRYLRDDGVVLFSVLHPVYWGTEFTKRDRNYISRILGVETIKGVNHVHGDYLNPSMKNTIIFGGVEIEYFHQPISLMINSILKSGFLIDQIIETKPQKELKEHNAEYYKLTYKIPQFIIFRLRKG